MVDQQAQDHIFLPKEVMNGIRASLEYSDRKKWIEWAWLQLVHASVVPAEVEDDMMEGFTRHVISLAALGNLYQGFASRWNGIEPDESDEWDIELFGGDGKLNFIDFIRYCERSGIDSDEYPESKCTLLHMAISQRANEVRRLLLEHVGTTKLFSSLVIAQMTAASYWNDDDEESPQSDYLEKAINDLSEDEILHGVPEMPTLSGSYAFM